MIKLRSPWIRLALFAFLGLAVILALQINWDRSYRKASGVPRSFAPFGDELRRADGSIDYRATLNKLLGEPPAPEQNALAIYLPLACQRELGSSPLRPQLLRTLGVSEAAFAAGKDFHADWEKSGIVSSLNPAALSAIWTNDAEFPEVTAWLDRYQPELDKIRAATKLRWYCPLLNDDPNALLVSDLLPHLQGMRTLSRMLVANCHREAGRGNVAAAIDDVLAIHRLGLQMRGDLVIQNLVAISIRAEARQAAIRLLQKYQLSETELDALRALADSEGIPELLDPNVSRSERYLTLDLLQQIDRNRFKMNELPDFGEPATAFPWVSKLWAFVDAGQVLQSVNNQFDEFGRSQSLLQIQGAALNEALSKFCDSSIQGSFPSGDWGEYMGMLFSSNFRGRVLGKSLSNGTDTLRTTSIKVIIRDTQQIRLLRVALALERFHGRNGNYPESLEQLVPDYLSQLPPDLFSEQGTFAYEKLAGGFGLSARAAPPAILKLGDELAFRLIINRSSKGQSTEERLP
jgi:hypothetical protein